MNLNIEIKIYSHFTSVHTGTLSYKWNELKIEEEEEEDKNKSEQTNDVCWLISF